MKHIYQDPYGYRLEIVRNQVTFRSYVRFGDDRAAALKKIVAIRDDYLSKAEVLRGRSNTGVAGVSELAHWTGGRPRQCFQVTSGSPGPNWMRRFFYTTLTGRQRALRRAVAHRARRTGENLTQLLEAANV